MTRAPRIALALMALIGAGAVGFAAARLLPATPSQTVPAADERKVLYWYDPMVPAQHFDQPGKSPFMDMELVPKYAGTGESAAAASPAVAIEPGLVQRLGVRLARVERGRFDQRLTAFGVVAFNGRDVAVVQPRANGFVQRVYDHAPGDVIAKGAPLADLLLPEWGGAQAEFLALVASGDAALIEAGRARLQLLGMTPGQVAAVERSRRPLAATTIVSPIAGVIDTLDVRQGMSVAMGQSLARINGLGTVWLEVAIPEAQAGAVHEGQEADATLAAYPGRHFTGRVLAVLPQTESETRSVKLRIELPNPERTLRPGMYAEVGLASPASEPVLLAPSEALIRTGMRSIVFVSAGDGRFRPVEVKTGGEANGRTAILSGLAEGDQVVASGQFLIDSEAGMQGILAKYDAPGEGSAATETRP